MFFPSFLSCLFCPGIQSRGDYPEVLARYITGVRKFGDWLLPLGFSLDNCFKPRPRKHDQDEVIDVPHCFTCIRGKQLSQRHRDLLTQPLDVNGVYICVKMYVRDLNLSQPPLHVVRSQSVVALEGDVPTSVHSQEALTSKQVASITKLLELCRHQYNLPAAADALADLIKGQVPRLANLSWVRLRDRHEEDPELEGHVYFPHLPKRCWQMVVKFRRQ